MRILPVTTNNYNESFKGIYKVPANSKNITDFERHVSPLFESYMEQPIKGVFDKFRGLLFVFTGKKDTALYGSGNPHQFGVITRINNGEKSIDKYTTTITNSHQRMLFANKTSNMQCQSLNNFKDLFIELFK